MRFEKYIYKIIAIVICLISLSPIKLSHANSLNIENINITDPYIIRNELSISAKITGSDQMLYQFWVKDLSTNLWTMIQDYSEKNTAKWTPEKTGEYLYGVHVKDSLSQASFD
ncbi:hypothetical protein J3A84_02885, partial [Proteiniclasticum sp. SCR006]|nr:hypothetical protein [Proteiniclasticum aestuarii]